MSKLKAENEEDHSTELEEVISDAKASAAVSILKAKIKLAEDLEHSRSWNVVGWSKALAKLIGKPVTTTEDHVVGLSV